LTLCWNTHMKTRYILMAAVLLLAGCSKSSSDGLTVEERAFAKKWNQWVDEHPKEFNAVRTRGLAEDLSQEEVSRELIALMVRFSTEEDIDIPQRFIDDLKKKAGEKN